MSDIKDGGAAFPESIAITPAGDVFYGMPGMSLRDYFAGQAMAGLMASPDTGTHDPEHFAVDAYRLADAMIKAREDASDE